MRKNQVILLYGVPAAGKYTMAKKLSEEKGFLLDNHYFHDMFKNITEVPEPRKKEYFDDVGSFKEVFLKIIQKFYPKTEYVRYIFTACIAEDEKNNILTFQKFADSIDADFIPIELKADIDVLKSRCQTDYRKWRKKISDPQKLERVIHQAFQKSPDFEHENKLCIESSFLNEEETFQIIKEFLKKFE